MEPISDKELGEYRYLFPVTKKFIYLNHAGVAPISIRVADAIEEFNQDALHLGFTASPQWLKRIEEIREKCASLINAHPNEIAFVKNTSHGISLLAAGLSLKPGDEAIISDLEFPTNVYPWMALEKKGIKLKKLSSSHGKLDLEGLESLVTSRTKVLSLSSVQYGTGYRLPVDEIGNFCRQKNIIFCVDAIQSLGAFPLDVQADQVDFLAADGHKWMLGHEGIGLMYVRKELIPQIEPVLLGWNSVQGALDFDKINFTLRETASRFEEGSLNGLSIYGLGAAVELLLDVGVERIRHRVLKLTDQLIEGLLSLGLTLRNTLDPKHRSGIILFNLPHDPDGKLLSELERHLYSKNIYTSIRRGALRLSPHFYNSEEEMEKTLKEIKGFLDNQS